MRAARVVLMNLTAEQRQALRGGVAPARAHERVEVVLTEEQRAVLALAQQARDARELVEAGKVEWAEVARDLEERLQAALARTVRS
ncbi:MAG TPA: hypothetical protein VFL90_06310 [Methylomirabilota bacterium]|nr:hypothetical protein [Methylomirabilota bacterium]